MKNYYLKLSAVIAILAGVLMGCGGDPNIETAKLNLRNADYDGVIEATQRAMDENPENADAYFYMGSAYLDRSEDLPPSERNEDLAKARELLLEADRLYREQEISSNEAQVAELLVTNAWSAAYTEGVSRIDFEGENDPEQVSMAIEYMHNAIALAPDSLINYEALSEIYYVADDIDNAINYMMKSIDRSPEPDVNAYQRVVFFYQVADRPDESFDLLQRARAEFPEEIFFTQEIANVYFRRGQRDEALEVLQELIELDPENAEYRLVFGTQIYQEYINLNNDINELYDVIFDLNAEYREVARNPQADANRLTEILDEIEAAETQIVELDEFRFEIAVRAEEQLMAAYEIDPDHSDITYTLGAINENKGIALADQRNLIDDMDELAELDARSREYFERALPFYIRTAELEPDEPENWLKLFQIYTRLGMEEEAMDAAERAGI